MANFPYNKHVHNKTFSYKTVSGGKMRIRIGSLVTNGLGGIGVVVDNHWRTFKVYWTTGACNWHDEIYLTVEVE